MSETYDKCNLWQTLYGKSNYGKCIYGKSIIANIIEPFILFIHSINP